MCSNNSMDSWKSDMHTALCKPHTLCTYNVYALYIKHLWIFSLRSFNKGFLNDGVVLISCR